MLTTGATGYENANGIQCSSRSCQRPARPGRFDGLLRRQEHHQAVRLLVLFNCVAFVDSFYLPGVAPHEYADGDKVEIKVNKLSSTKTQVSGAEPLAF
jgi:hypothetical protein